MAPKCIHEQVDGIVPGWLWCNLVSLEPDNSLHVCLVLPLSCTCFQGYQDGRDRMIHRSTSQGSINSPVYSRHSYTPTTSRSPQHFHRPGKGTCSRDSLSRVIRVSMWLFSPPLIAYLKIWLPNLSAPLPEKIANSYSIVVCVISFLKARVILGLCSLWLIK